MIAAGPANKGRLPRAAAAAALLVVFSAWQAAARKVRFGVVAFGKDVQVSVAGVSHPMGAPDIHAPYYWGNHEVPDAFTYKYVVDGVPEPFDRQGPNTSVSRTFNDFYGRQHTVLELPRLPHPFGDSWTRGIGLTPLFDDSYIPTVHLAGDPTRINDVWSNMSANNTANVTMTVVLASYVLRFEDVRYAISAAGRSQNYAKQAYRLKLARGDSLFGRDEWKLRCGEEDPTQLREAVYSKILIAMGCPVIHSNLVRLYVNKEPVGLFVMGDDANQRSTIRTLFHGAREYALTTKQTGAIYEANSFVFTETDPSGGLVQYQIGDNPRSDPYATVKKMTAAVAAARDDAGLDRVNELLDLETYMRAHAMEFLTFHWDSAWAMGSNYMMYEDSKFTKKIWFSDEDFDQTFGIAVSAIPGGGSDAARIPYTGFPPGNASDGSTSQLMPRILASQRYAARFRQILVDTVKHLFNPVALGAHLRAAHARFAPEVKWDREAPRRQNGKPDNWVYADFEANLEKGVRGAQWGVLQWVQERAASLASQLGFAWDPVAQPAPAPVVTPPPANPARSAGDKVKSGISKDTVAAAPRSSADAFGSALSSLVTVTACAAAVALQNWLVD